MKGKNSALATIMSLSTTALLLTLLPTFNADIIAKESPEPRQIATDFRAVAKKAIPAVVSIKVKGAAPSPNMSMGFGTGQGWRGQSDEGLGGSSSNDPLEEFWKNFFGGSSRRQQEAPQPFSGQASGFIVSADGYVLTNAHVVSDAAETTVGLNDGRDFPAKVIGFDSNIDIALLKIEAKDLPYLVLGDSDKLEVGQWVCTVGNPLGLQASLTVGVVSATGRNNLDLTRIEDFIQTDAAINRGNSGGPLLDLDEEVVGINTAIVTNMATGGYMGIGFAIPSNLAKHVMEQLQTNGHVSRGFVGIMLQPIDSNLAQSFGLSSTQGALITDISAASPAERAGLKQGDIITKINGRPVANISALRNSISLMQPATEISLTVLRDGKSLTIPVVVAEFPGNEKTALSLYNKLGFEVEATKSVSDGGVTISKVAPASIAAWAGLRQGAVILEVNQQKVTSVEEFQRLLSTAPTDRPILFLIKQGGVTRFISLKVN